MRAMAVQNWTGPKGGTWKVFHTPPDHLTWRATNQAARDELEGRLKRAVANGAVEIAPPLPWAVLESSQIFADSGESASFAQELVADLPSAETPKEQETTEQASEELASKDTSTVKAPEAKPLTKKPATKKPAAAMKTMKAKKAKKTMKAKKPSMKTMKAKR